LDYYDVNLVILTKDFVIFTNDFQYIALCRYLEILFGLFHTDNTSSVPVIIWQSK